MGSEMSGLSLDWEAEKDGLLAQVPGQTLGKSPPHSVLVTLGWGGVAPSSQRAHLQAQQDWAACPICSSFLPGPCPQRGPSGTTSPALNPAPPRALPVKSADKPAGSVLFQCLTATQPGSAQQPGSGFSLPGPQPLPLGLSLLLLSALGLSRPLRKQSCLGGPARPGICLPLPSPPDDPPPAASLQLPSGQSQLLHPLTRPSDFADAVPSAQDAFPPFVPLDHPSS